MERVRLTPRAKRLLLASALEVYPKETTGFLLCKLPRSGRTLLVDGIYTIQTSIRKRGEVEHGNVSAVERVISAISVMDGKGFVGGYHSHPDHIPKLTKSDVEYAEAELGRFKKYGIKPGKWLEIVIGVRRKTYERHEKLGWSYISKGDRDRIVLRVSGGNGSAKYKYEVNPRAYWVYKENGVFRKKEAKLYLP